MNVICKFSYLFFNYYFFCNEYSLNTVGEDFQVSLVLVNL